MPYLQSRVNAGSKSTLGVWKEGEMYSSNAKMGYQSFVCIQTRHQDFGVKLLHDWRDLPIGHSIISSQLIGGRIRI